MFRICEWMALKRKASAQLVRTEGILDQGYSEGTLQLAVDIGLVIVVCTVGVLRVRADNA